MARLRHVVPASRQELSPPARKRRRQAEKKPERWDSRGGRVEQRRDGAVLGRLEAREGLLFSFPQRRRLALCW